MAQFRLSVAIASRSAARSVVAMAAYRAGCRLRDERSGKVHDYAQKRGVVYAGVVLPHNAPAWAGREQLWNRVEEREGRSDAQLGREVLLSLPHELSGSQRRELALKFARHLAAEYGFAVDVAIHAPSEQGDSRNHHAHLLVTSRAFDASRKCGWAKAKDRRLDAIAMRRAGTQNVVEGLRQVWEAMENAALVRADVRDGCELVRVDRRSYARQGLTIKPGLHDGPEATAFKRRRESGSRTVRLPSTRAVKSSSVAKRGSLPGRSGFRRNGLFKTRHPAEAIRAFNEGLAVPTPGAEAIRRAEEVPLTKRLNTDPINTDPIHSGRQFGKADPQESSRPTQPWRWQELDALNQELAEPVEEERKKEREGGKGKPPVLLDTDPRQDNHERTPPPQPEWQAYRRSR